MLFLFASGGLLFSLPKSRQKASQSKTASLIGELEVNTVFSALCVCILFSKLTASFAVLFIQSVKAIFLYCHLVGEGYVSGV